MKGAGNLVAVNLGRGVDAVADWAKTTWNQLLGKGQHASQRNDDETSPANLKMLASCLLPVNFHMAGNNTSHHVRI